VQKIKNLTIGKLMPLLDHWFSSRPLHDAIIYAYGNYMGQISLCGLLSHVQSCQKITTISGRMVSIN